MARLIEEAPDIARWKVRAWQLAVALALNPSVAALSRAADGAPTTLAAHGDFLPTARHLFVLPDCSTRRMGTPALAGLHRVRPCVMATFAGWQP